MPTDEEYRQRAKNIYNDDNIFIDGHAEVDEMSKGAWVQAWIFIPIEDISTEE